MSGITTLGTSKKIALICLNGNHVELRYVNTGWAPIAASRPALGQCSVDLELYKGCDLSSHSVLATAQNSHP